ncbi:MAG: hypothetical protein JXB00_10905, partial [Bacteroidales bacterium]|nr:hypothetical protein [Bacteroidales bacterium]
MTRYYLLSVLLFICLSAFSQDDLTISDPVFGKVEVSAPNSVTLSPGFHAVEGSDFRAYIGENQSVLNAFNTAVTEQTVAGVPSDDENYIKSITYREPLSSFPTGDYKHLEQIQYFDGLGRLKQTIQVNASPSGYDLIQPVVYDAFGNESYKYLPYPTNSNGAFQESAQLYSMYYYDEGTVGRIADNNAKVYIEYDNSPLNRVMKQFGPGEAWHENDGKPITYGYTTNTGEVTNWTVDEDGVFTEDDYPEKSLYITETTDEEGNTTREYKDKQGKVVQKESELEGNWLRTLYIYDDFDLLRCVVPPKATSPITDVELCYYYTYDHRNRMIGKKLPGAEPVYMVYDKRDRLVLTQDGKRRANDDWAFTKYDIFNRPVITGIFIAGEGVSHSYLIEQFENHTGDMYETYIGAGTGNLYGYTPNNSFPSSIYQISADDILTVTYYDNYNFVSDLGINQDEVYNCDSYNETDFNYTQSTKRKGLVTGVMTKFLTVYGSGYTPEDNMLYSVNYYDNYGNVIRNISDNHKGGRDVISTNFKPVTFEVESTLQLHTGLGDDLRILKKFTYDHAGRLLKTTQQINEEDEITLNAMVYNELGELVTKYLHSKDAGDSKNFLQKTDYTYNVRGWLKKINDPALSDDNDVFGMELFYNDIAGLNSLAPEACYNGNIAGMKWGVQGDLAQLRVYGFGYDELNRLKTSSYADGAGLADNTGYYNENITEYDANGNIVKLNRSFGAELVDDLTYYYFSGSNQIRSITDEGVASDLVDDYPGSSGTYTYDQNGNMSTDGGKMLTVAYNHLNLPRSVAFGGNNNIFYHYSATGAKLVKYVDEFGGTDAVTHYIGNIVYNGDEIAYILTEEGRMVPYGTGLERLWLSEYHLKDHLGNTRAVISGNTPGGAVEILQYSSYYPFGMPFAMKEFGAMGNEYANNKYLYNGKELQDDMLAGKKMDWYDYGA